MSETEIPKRIALLIDAENIGPQYMRQVLPEVFKLGRPSIQFSFGDFSNPTMKNWVEYLRKNVIEARQVTPAESGKNAADIALVVEAMALALTNKCEAICLVSSDRDFVPLMMFLKREGIDAYGFGEAKTDKKYRQSCAKFFELKAEADAEVEVKPKPIPQPTASPAAEPSLAGSNWPAIFQEIARLCTTQGWTSLQELGAALGKRGIHAKDHGGANWAKVLCASPDFAIKADATGRRSVRVVASGPNAKVA